MVEHRRRAGDPPPTTGRGPARRILVAATAGQVLLTVALVGYALSVVLRPAGHEIPLLDSGVVNVVQVASALLALASVLHPRADRSVSLALGCGLLLWSAGDLVWALLPGDGAPASPNPADPLFLACYPCVYLALIMMIRAGAADFLPSSWLDGVMCGLGAAAVSATFVFGRVLAATGGRPLEVAVNLAYPAADLALLAVAAAALALLPQRRDARWLLLIAGCAAFVASDTAYLLASAAGTYRPGTMTDVGWPAGLLLMSIATWRQPAARSLVRMDGAVLLVMPGISAAAGAGILVYGTRRHLGTAAVVLATATLVAAAFRVLLAHRDLRTLSESQYQALTDDLTGLGNRRMFDRRLTGALDSAAAGGHHGRLAILLVDLDHFKEINDSFGHPAGDELLRMLSDRLATAVRRSDLLVRLGGDEFALLLQGSDTEYAIEVAQRLTGEIHRPFPLAQSSFEIRASIGIARYPQDAADASGLLRCADVAMYRAKGAGYPFTVYDRARDDSRDRFELLTDLRRALDTDELTVHYQPQLDLRTGEIVSAEALVRWRHPVRGPIPPDTFVPLAEETGLIRSLTEYVLDHAVAQCAVWRVSGLGIAVAVNVSANDVIGHDLVDRLDRLLAQHGLPPEAVALEITERVLMADVTRARTTIQQLRDRGVIVSLDDFGTGFSSLAYLRELAVGELKLDRSFIAGMTADDAGPTADDAERDIEIVRSVIDLAHALGLRVVAEGIEDDRTLRILARLGCDLGQGYHIGRPMPAEQLARSGYGTGKPLPTAG